MSKIMTKLHWGLECTDPIVVKQLLLTRKVRSSCDTYPTQLVAASMVTSDYAIPIPFQICTNNIPLESISPDMCYIVGLVYGDGCIQQTQVIFNNKDVSLMARFAGTFDSRINGPYTGSMVMQSSVSTTKFGPGIELIMINDSKQLNIDKVSLLSLEQFAAFVAGWIDADGFCYEYPGRDSQSVSITDIRWTDDVGLLFAKFGAVVSVHWLKPTAPHLQPPAVFIIRNARSEFWNYMIHYGTKLKHWTEDMVMKKAIKPRANIERSIFTFNYSNDFGTLYVRGV